MWDRAGKLFITPDSLNPDSCDWVVPDIKKKKYDHSLIPDRFHDSAVCNWKLDRHGSPGYLGRHYQLCIWGYPDELHPRPTKQLSNYGYDFWIRTYHYRWYIRCYSLLCFGVPCQRSQSLPGMVPLPNCLVLSVAHMPNRVTYCADWNVRNSI